MALHLVTPPHNLEAGGVSNSSGVVPIPGPMTYRAMPQSGLYRSFLSHLMTLWPTLIMVHDFGSTFHILRKRTFPGRIQLSI